MKKDEIRLFDIERILLGEAPAEFLIEVFLRSIVTYVILLVVLKLLGKRMTGKLTNTEMAVMLMFGAVVSSAMQLPDRGVIESTFVLLLILIFQRGTTLWAFKKQRVEDQVIGTINMLVKDGVMQLDTMSKEKISRNQLFRLLRLKQIRNLGQVKRLYMETTGTFTLYQNKQPAGGLSVLPEADPAIQQIQEVSEGTRACNECGTLSKNKQLVVCPHCQSTNWVAAVK